MLQVNKLLLRSICQAQSVWRRKARNRGTSFRVGLLQPRVKEFRTLIKQGRWSIARHLSNQSNARCTYYLLSRSVQHDDWPSSFNWELLQKARAVDNQIFVVTCSPARDTEAGYIAWGHSTVVGPFGEILATTEHEEATIIADIDYSQLDTRRQNMPLEFQRRGDLYHLTDATRAR